ncbi:hypothetical protein ACK3F5_13185 [Photorhabdus asymbiotica UENP]
MNASPGANYVTGVSKRSQQSSSLKDEGYKPSIPYRTHTFALQLRNYKIANFNFYKIFQNFTTIQI